MMDMKFEYLAEISGKAMETIEKLFGITEGAYWFETEEERSAFLQKVTPYHKLGLGVIYREGTTVRLKTVALMEFEYEGKTYHVERDFGYGFSEETARFQLELGNPSCDCIRSRLIQEYFPEFAWITCGETINMVALRIELRAGEYVGV
jgi:hypothetical protein